MRGDGRLEVPRNFASWGPKTVDCMADGEDVKLVSLFKPRNNDQKIIAEEIITLLGQGSSFIFEAPTGYGKTIIGAHCIAAIGKKTLIVVHKDDLVQQWQMALKEVLYLEAEDVGHIQADNLRVGGCPVVIAMVQSMSKEARYPTGTFDKFGLVIWDECHRVSADHFINSAFRVPAKLRLGMSATPDRLDGKELVFESHVGAVMVRTEAAALIPKVIGVRTRWKVPMKRDPNTGHWEQLWHEPTKDMHVIKAMASNEQRNRIIVGFTVNCWKKGRKIMVFSVLKKHLERLHVHLIEAGISDSDIAYYVGGMSAKARAKAKEKHVLLGTYKMTSEGTDIPELDTAVLSTPFANIAQPVGRILRECEGKYSPVVLDLIDDDSELYRRYWMKRRRWYQSKGSEIVER